MTVSATRSIPAGPAAKSPARTEARPPNVGPRLPRSFYARPTLRVARDLLGKTLVFDSPDGRRAVRLVEVEAYLGARDPASHAHRGVTPRNAPMFGRAGHSYVYFVYGMYWCLNVVTESPGIAGAVLLRGAEPVVGLPEDACLLAGPGRLARALGVSGVHTGLDLVRGGPLSIRDAPPVPPSQVARTPRVGLNPGTTVHKPWRFIVRGSAGVTPQARAGFASPSRRAHGAAGAGAPERRRRDEVGDGPGD